MNRHSLILSLAFFIAAAGCSTTPLVGRPAPPPRSDAPRLPPVERPSPAEAGDRDESHGPAPAAIERRPEAIPEPAPTMPPAAAALLEQSRTQSSAGQYGAAASSIERALRIDPNNAALWIELAEVKLADNDPMQAEQMARKALTLAGSDRAITVQAERLLARTATCAGGGC